MITALTFEPQVSQPNCDPHYWLINRGRWGLDLLSMTFARKRLARLARGGRGVAAFRPGVWLTHTDPIHPQPRCLRLNLVNPIVFDLITVTRGGLRLFETCWGLRIGCLLSSILPLGNDLIKYWSTSGRRSFGFFLTATLQRSWFFVFSYDQDGVALRWDKLIFFLKEILAIRTQFVLTPKIGARLTTGRPESFGRRQRSPSIFSSL